MTADWVTQNEFSVVGALLMEPEHIGEVAAILRPDDIHSDAMRTIYAAMLELHLSGQPISAYSVLSAVGGDHDVGVREAVDWAPFARSDIPFYAQVIVDQSRLSAIRQTAVQLASCETLDAAGADIDKLTSMMVSRSTVRITDASAAAENFCKRVGADEKPEYLQWGFAALDDKIYAQGGDLILLGGYPSAGKTALAVQFALGLAEDHRVGFFSLETCAVKLTDRIMASCSGVPLPKIKTRALSEEDWVAIAQAASRISKLRLSIIEAAGMTVHDIRSVSLAQRYDIVFIDYLQLVSEKGRDRYEQVTAISQKLHTFSQSSGVTVIALAQLSRPDKTKGKPEPPTMSSFRESGQIEQDADVAMLLYQRDADDYRSPRVLKLSKNKEGEKAVLDLDFDGATQVFSVHKKTAGEQYRAIMTMKNVGNPCQVKITEIADTGGMPF